MSFKKLALAIVGLSFSVGMMTDTAGAQSHGNGPSIPPQHQPPQGPHWPQPNPEPPQGPHWPQPNPYPQPYPPQYPQPYPQPYPPQYPQPYPPQYPQPPRSGHMNYNHAQQLVQLLYRAILFRNADPQGLDSNIAALMQNGSSILGQLAYNMGESDEFYNNIAPRYNSYQIVANLYTTLLNRQGEASGVRNWVTKMNQGQFGDVMRGFVESQEFRRLHRL